VIVWNLPARKSPPGRFFSCPSHSRAVTGRRHALWQSAISDEIYLRAVSKSRPGRNGSQTWWIKFSDWGIARRESSHSTDYAVAEKPLKKRLAETLTQTYAPSVNVKIDKLIEDVFIDYSNQNCKNLVDVKRRWTSPDAVVEES
jgi:hypothetical protein